MALHAVIQHYYVDGKKLRSFTLDDLAWHVPHRAPYRKMAKWRIKVFLWSLGLKGLVERIKSDDGQTLYRLTPKGAWRLLAADALR